LTSKERVSHWSDAYSLTTRLKARADQEDALRNENVTAKVEVFQAYVGAVFRLYDFRAVEDWLAPIVLEALEDIEVFENAKDLPDLGFDETTVGFPNNDAANPDLAPDAGNHLQPLPQLEARNGNNGKNGQEGPKIGLGFFNEQCSKRRIEVKWDISRDGPSHLPTFHARITCKSCYTRFFRRFN
jgi:hypothetical protein